MTRSQTVPEDIEDEDIEVVEAIEPGSLEWFRSHAPLPLVLEAFFEVKQHRVEAGHPPETSADYASERDPDIRNLLETDEVLAEYFELFSDPNAKEIVARLRRLTGCEGRLKNVEPTNLIPSARSK